MKQLNIREKAWQGADIREPFLFALCFYEHPELLLSMMNLFFPAEGLKRIRRMYSTLADLLESDDPCLRADAEGSQGRVQLCLDYIQELTDEPCPGTGIRSKGHHKTLNLTICRNDPFTCENPILRVTLNSRDFAPSTGDDWIICGVLLSLHEKQKAEDKQQQEVLRYFREGVAEGELCEKIDAAVQQIKGSEDWKLLYLEKRNEAENA